MATASTSDNTCTSSSTHAVDDNVAYQPVVNEELERREIAMPAGGASRAVIVIESYAGGPPPLPVPPAPSFTKSSQSDDGQDGGGTSAIKSVFVMSNSAIGAGVLALPFAFAKAGMLGGILLCIFIGSLEAFTLYVLSKFSERYGAHTYGSLVRRVLGRKLAALLAAFMIAFLWGACACYQIILGDTVTSLASPALGPDHPLANRQLVITGLGVAVLLPLCMLRNLSELSHLSAIAVIGFIFTAGVVCWTGYTEAMARGPNFFEGVVLFKWDVNALMSLSILTFGFNCHANVVNVFSELGATPDRIIPGLPGSPTTYHRLHSLAPRPGSHKMINMLGVIIAAIALTMVGYLVVGIAGYMAVPLAMRSNILNALPDTPAVQVAKALIAVVVLGHYPLNHFPARAGLDDVLGLLGCAHPHLSRPLSFIFTLVFVGSSTAVALCVTSLGKALHLLGGTAAAFMIFFLPGLMLINAALLKESSSMLDLFQQDPEGAASRSSLSEPLLRDTAERGVKALKHRTALVYSPRKSWAAGVFLVVFSSGVFVVTIITAFLQA